jgi:hypothetical protein
LSPIHTSGSDVTGGADVTAQASVADAAGRVTADPQ